MVSKSWKINYTSHLCNINAYKCLFICLLMIFSSGSVNIDKDGGYDNIIISISTSVPSTYCKNLLVQIKDILKISSEIIYNGTHGRGYFKKLTVILPPNWDARSCGNNLLVKNFVTKSKTTNSVVQIGESHPIFNSAPWTLQPKGCGESGELISIGYTYFLTNHPSPYSKAEKFVHEWSKYRYGVFEEIGFDDDPIYPIEYYSSKEVNILDEPRVYPSVCNKSLHNTLSWTTSDDVGGSIFCEERNHNRESPTKQNIQCDHKSTLQVILSSEDFKGSEPFMSRYSTPSFEIKQLTKPKFIILVEESGNMNLRDVWKYLKLAIRKFIKYDLPTGTEIGLITITSRVHVLSNITQLDKGQRIIIADKLPNYPDIDSGTLTLRRGIITAINLNIVDTIMGDITHCKVGRVISNGERESHGFILRQITNYMLKKQNHPGSSGVIVLISGGSFSQQDLDSSMRIIQQEGVSVSTIEYPSTGQNKVSKLSILTNSPYFFIRETGVGTMSHISTYIQLVNSIRDIQRYFTQNIVTDWPTLVHQEEFKGDSPSFVESSFNYEESENPGEFHLYVTNSIDPKVNRLELTSPSGIQYTNQLSQLHDVNIIKIGAPISEPGIWRYRIERLGDSHQSHFVQVIKRTTIITSEKELNVKVYSNVDKTKTLDLTEKPLIIYARVCRGKSPVLGANVKAFVYTTNIKWSVKLFDSGNGDPDITKDDGVYSRYIVPPSSIQTTVVVLNIQVQVKTSPYTSKYIRREKVGRSMNLTQSTKNLLCCGSRMNIPLELLERMPLAETISSLYLLKLQNTLSHYKNSYPPSRIGDLKLVSLSNSTISVGFTAPGDDFDHGSVFKYIVYCSRYYNKGFRVITDILLDSPISSGSRATLQFQVESYGLYYIGICAADRLKLESKMSNIIQVYVKNNINNSRTGNDKMIELVESVSLNNQMLDRDFTSSRYNTSIVWSIICAICITLILLAILLVYVSYVRKSKTRRCTDNRISCNDATNVPMSWPQSEMFDEDGKDSMLPTGKLMASHNQLSLNTKYSVESGDVFNTVESGSSLKSFQPLDLGGNSVSSNVLVRNVWGSPHYRVTRDGEITESKLSDQVTSGSIVSNENVQCTCTDHINDINFCSFQPFPTPNVYTSGSNFNNVDYVIN